MIHPDVVEAKKRRYLFADWTFCSSSSKKKEPYLHQNALTFQGTSPLFPSSLVGLSLITDWLELSIANDEEKCYSANHNGPGASLSVPGGL